MVKWFEMLFNPELRQAARTAKAYVETDATATAQGVRLLADESDRWVFAVFYRGSMPARPTPYKVVVAIKGSDQVHELDDCEASQYRLRDYK